jgi:hypothetical protein
MQTKEWKQKEEEKQVRKKNVIAKQRNEVNKLKE